ncbi:MAG: NUDIX domain-containing protein [Candidatus Taylorbacteria bacterium]|nr:NUDIX domain-containing protein [Candidatus Taylorbacteria bacterium]
MPHIHEKIDFTVEVFIVHKDRVLLRMHDKYKKWLSVGGHIELYEDPIEAAVREVKEEVGLDIELVGSQKIFEGVDHTIELLPPIALNRNRVSPTHEHVTFVYFARTDKTEIKAQYEDDKSEECRWCTEKDLSEMDLWPNVKAYALEALHRLGK